MTFVDDSPPLQRWGREGQVVDCEYGESDRSSGRIVIGTSQGDIYVFVQRPVRLVPREVRHLVKPTPAQ